MEVIKNTIYFRSNEGNYWNEITGAKANTVRQISDEELCKHGLCVDPRGFMKTL